MNELKQIPVFVINGFLEAGKTQFTKFTMQQDYFITNGKTLLIVCEEGEEEYDKEMLEKYNTVAIYIEDLEELSLDKLRKLDKEYKPERVIIEWNGIWLQDKLVIPSEWFINQMVSIFDTSTMDLYFKNMKAFMGPMLKYTELIICNRADDIEEETLAKYHLSLRAMAANAEIVFEGKDGEIRGDFSIELPYNLDDKIIKIENKDFGIFYVDSIDTCCEDDVQYLGHICNYKGAINLKNRQWVKVRARLEYKYHDAYKQEGPVFEAIEVIHTGEVNEIVSF